METNTDLLTQLQDELKAAEDLNVTLADRFKRLDALVWSGEWPSSYGPPEAMNQARNMAYEAHRSNLHSSQLLQQAIEYFECNYDGEPA